MFAICRAITSDDPNYIYIVNEDDHHYYAIENTTYQWLDELNKLSLLPTTYPNVFKKEHFFIKHTARIHVGIKPFYFNYKPNEEDLPHLDFITRFFMSYQALHRVDFLKRIRSVITFYENKIPSLLIEKLVYFLLGSVDHKPYRLGIRLDSKISRYVNKFPPRTTGLII